MPVDHPPDVHARIPKIRERLAASKSGYIRVIKFGVPDRTAITIMIENGEVEIFKSALGKAYRLVKKPEELPRSETGHLTICSTQAGPPENCHICRDHL